MTIPAQELDRARFEALVAAVEPALRRALVAAYGADAGREATADAMAWAWANLDRVHGLDNPGGYLWRVGQTAARRARRWTDRRSDRAVPDVGGDGEPPGVEPALAPALSRLSPQQRAAVVLVHGWGYTLDGAAAALGCQTSTVRNHIRRGLAKLRSALGVDDG